MQLSGQTITLIPIKPEEKEEFFKLATKTYGSKYWYDENEKSTLTRRKFFKDWSEDYFDSNSPKKGQCFWITAKGEKIGQINYNPIDERNKKVELDIIIGMKDTLGKGYGTDALKVLIKYLFSTYKINKITIEARANNTRAIKAYEKVGFSREGLLREENYFKGKFVDCVRFGIIKKDLMTKQNY